VKTIGNHNVRCVMVGVQVVEDPVWRTLFFFSLAFFEYQRDARFHASNHLMDPNRTSPIIHILTYINTHAMSTI